MGGQGVAQISRMSGLLLLIGLMISGTTLHTLESPIRIDDSLRLVLGPRNSAQNPDFTTYFGGSEIEDATKIAFDLEGNTLLIGQTQSYDLPVSEGAFQTSYSPGDWDSFVAKFDSSGQMVFATYLGGSAYEHVTTVTVDADNNIIVAGVTWSSGFNTTQDAYQASYGGSGDGFITVFSPEGELQYSTFFGGPGQDWIYGLEFDNTSNIMFGGFTSSEGMATSGAYQEELGGLSDAFAAKLSLDEGTLLTFTYLGGPGNDRAWTMTTDSSYNYLISGMTESEFFPTSNDAYQETYGGGTDAFLARISSDGSTLVFSSYLGGDEEEFGLGLDVDSEDNIILCGPTSSDNFPVINALHETYRGGLHDIYASKWTPSGENIFTTYLGGNRTDRAWDARVDPSDDIVIVARTTSDNFPILFATQNNQSGNYDACVLKLASNGQEIQASTFVGGSGSDIGEGLAIDPDGQIVISGRTSSPDFPVSPDAFQMDKAGGYDVYVCHSVFDFSSTTTETTSPATTPTDVPGLPLDSLMIVGFFAVLIIAALVVLFVRRR
jgi:hypothetical protein